MINLSATNTAIINATSKRIFWAFDLTLTDATSYNWSTVSYTYSGTPYTFKINPESFGGVELNRGRSELGIQAPSTLTFEVNNAGNTLTAADFKDAELHLKLIMSDYTNESVIRSWRFIVKRAEPKMQVLKFHCEDYTTRYLRGSYPNTRYVRDIFPETFGVQEDRVCVPKTWGQAYIPLRSVLIKDFHNYNSTTISAIASSNGSRCKINDTSSGLSEFEEGRTVTISGFTFTQNNGAFSVKRTKSTEIELGENDGLVIEAAGDSVTLKQNSRAFLLGTTEGTYTISAIKTPRALSKPTEFSSTKYTFTQFTKAESTATNWRVFHPIIYGYNDAGNAYLPGIFQEGSDQYDAPVKFSNSLTSVMTSPADIIKNVLTDMGVPAAKLKNSTSLVGYWACDETSGTAAFDNSGYGNTGTLENSAVPNSSGKSNYCVLCNGVAGGLDVGNASPYSGMGNGSWWASLWVKATSTTITSNSILSAKYQDGSNLINLRSNGTNNQLTGSLIKGGVSASANFSSTGGDGSSNIFDTDWHHLVLSINRTDNRLKLWVDSKKNVTEIDISTLPSDSSNTGRLSFGAMADGTQCLNGKIDEVRVYTGVPTTANIEELFYNYSMRGWFDAARRTYKSWGLEWNGGLWYKEERQKILAKLLTMCNSALIPEDTIGLYPLLKASQQTITKADVLTSGGATGRSTFDYSEVISDEISNCGYIAWQQSGQPTDKFLRILVPADGLSLTYISEETIELPFVQDSQEAQKLGTLHYQRKLPVVANEKFKAKITALALQPNDVITVNHADYGGSHSVLIDSMKINKDGSIDLNCLKYSISLKDWEDLAPGAITLTEDDSNSVAWEPAISGPLSSERAATSGLQTYGRPFLVVGQYENQGDYTNIQAALNQLIQSKHSGILLRNGVHLLTSPVYFPNKPLTITGESKTGVIVKPAAGQKGFVLYNLTESFLFQDFTMESRNTSTYVPLIHTYGSLAANNTTKTTFRNLNFYLATTTDENEKAIYLEIGSGSSIISECYTTNGYCPFDIKDYLNVICEKNIITGSVWEGIAVWSSNPGDSKKIFISQNQIQNFFLDGVAVRGYADDVSISLNKIRNISFPVSLASGTIKGIYLEVSRADVTNNDIRYEGTNIDEDLALNGIYCYSSTYNHNITGNTIYIVIDNSGMSASPRLHSGIHSYARDCVISNNNIYIDYSNVSVPSVGVRLRLAADRNVVSGNNIDMVNNTANEVGISLYSGTNNNQGGDNITYNVGTSISDAGTGNVVTAQDV